MSYVEESRRASSTVIFEATAENITAVYLDIKDLAASFTVYKMGEFTYSIVMIAEKYCFKPGQTDFVQDGNIFIIDDIVILGICGLLTIINGIVDIRL